MPDNPVASSTGTHSALAEAGGPHHEEHPSYQRHHFETVGQQADATNFAMWLFLLTEVMFFGGLFTAYLIYRNWYYPAFVSASHQLNVGWGTANTAVLIFSSFTMAMGVWCAETRRRRGLVLCLASYVFLRDVLSGHQEHRVPRKDGRSTTFPVCTTAFSRFSIRPPTPKFTRNIMTSRCPWTWRVTPSFTSSSTSQ